MATGSAVLTYYLFEGVLVGTAGGKMFHIFAVSGGGGGSTSTKKGWIDDNLVNNPDATSVKTQDGKGGHHHGGPIPVGSYTIAKPGHHPHLGYSARLIADKGNHMMGRDGFFIHGRGPHGSDGCMVPLNGSELHDLLNALEKDGGGVLTVLRQTLPVVPQPYAIA
jgi:hypothetical protein